MKKFLKITSVITLLLFLRASFALATDQVYFYYTDPAGSPLAMSDSSGAVVWRADYLPFGEETIDTPTVPNNKMFVGKEKDSESGLYYFGARYMDAATGRFVSPDSIGPVDSRTGKINQKRMHNLQNHNLYAYTANNPYKFFDPDGRDGVLVQFRGYPVDTGLGFKLPLGHGAVIAIEPNTGRTKYFEYGRYDKEKFGVVKEQAVPNVVMDKDGRPTADSLKNLYDFISTKYGKDSSVDASYYGDANFQKIADFANDRKNDTKRKAYSLWDNTCKTFAGEAIDAGRKKE